jgi:hypothetical protein
VVLCIERQRGAGALHTLWAEDGKLFLNDAISRPILDTMARPYNGYLHVGPRLVASLAAVLPLRYAAAVLSGSGALAASTAAAIGYHASASHIPSRVVRLVIAAFVVLLPGAGLEASNNLANAHWYLVYGGFWLLLWPTQRPFELAISSVVLALGALSDPLSLLLVPVLAIRLAVLRDRRTLVPAGAFVLGLGLQLIGVAIHGSERFIHHHITWPSTLVGYVRFGLASSLVQSQWLVRRHLDVLGWALLAVILLASLLTAVRSRDRAPLLILLLVMSFAWYVAPVRISGYSVPRYWVLPGLFALSALGVCVNDALTRAGPGRAWLVTAMSAALIVIATVDLTASYSVYGRRGKGPTWEEGLRIARERCSAGASMTIVPITPRGTKYHWSVTLPCDRLVRSAAAVAPGPG